MSRRAFVPPMLKANGFMTMAFHGGVLLGPPLGGLLIDLASWRWIFFLLVPPGVIGVVLTVVRARGSREVAARRQPAIDYVGAALLVALTVVLTLLLDRKSAELVGVGHQGLMTVVLAATLLGFVAHERHVINPIVNLALFKIRMFTFSILSLIIIATTTSVLGLLLPFYIQDVLHLSPSSMGLIFLAAPVFTIALATAAGQLTDRIGPRIPATIGIVFTMGAFVTGVLLRTDSHWILPTALMGFFGLGSGFFNTPNQTAIIGSVPKEYRGFATGMVQTVFGVGSLLGISLAGVLLTVMFRYYSGIPDATPSPADPRAFVAAMNATYLACLALMLVALTASVMRGRARVEAASSTT